jgi:hypothetical protein
MAFLIRVLCAVSLVLRKIFIPIKCRFYNAHVTPKLSGFRSLAVLKHRRWMGFRSLRLRPTNFAVVRCFFLVVSRFCAVVRCFRAVVRYFRAVVRSFLRSSQTSPRCSQIVSRGSQMSPGCCLMDPRGSQVFPRCCQANP